MIWPARFDVPSAFFTSYGVANLVVTRWFFSTNFLLMKLVVAPESTRASACAFCPNTHRVIGSLNEVFLLRATLLSLDSISTLSISRIDSVLGIVSWSTSRTQSSSTSPRENPSCDQTIYHTSSEVGLPDLTVHLPLSQRGLQCYPARLPQSNRWWWWCSRWQGSRHH